MKIGQRVIINSGEFSESIGTLVGTSVIHNDKGDINNMYIVKLDNQYSGYLNFKSGNNCFISMVVVHPSNTKKLDY